MDEGGLTVPNPRRSPDTREPVLAVAVDGSAASVRGLVWALRRASEEGWQVEIVTAWPVASVPRRALSGQAAEPRWLAAEIQEIAVAKARALVPDPPPYRRRLEKGEILDVLVSTSNRVQALVIGTDRGPDRHIQPDPTALGDRVAARAACPVLLISGSAPAAEPPDPEPLLPVQDVGPAGVRRPVEAARSHDERVQYRSSKAVTAESL